MDDLVIFKFLQDVTIPVIVRNDLKQAFESFNEEKVECIVEKILLVKTVNVLLELND